MKQPQGFSSSSGEHLLYKVRVSITCLCFIFNVICSKVIDPKKLDELDNETAIVLCQMEMYFPP